jgi:Nucleotidyl transferase AbiEii toxin, Type IV TA system
MLQARSDREAGKVIERFHLAFVEVAAVRLPIADFVLKGGANMRFFFRSPRRSRDIDFNYLGTRSESFAGRVDEVLKSRALIELLRQHEITLVNPRRYKQTETTRRWKLSLQTRAVESADSKIEFSATEEPLDDFELRPIDTELARRLGGRSIPINRYGAIAMVTQKVNALRYRSETQPRDIFDLDLLFRTQPDALAQALVEQRSLEETIERARALTYHEYLTTVVDYLEEEIVDVVGTKDSWNDMLRHVVEKLEARWIEVYR